MCIFVCFVLMLLVNVCHQWTCEFKNVKFIVGFVLMLLVNVCHQWTCELKNVEFLVGLLVIPLGALRLAYGKLHLSLRYRIECTKCKFTFCGCGIGFAQRSSLSWSLTTNKLAGRKSIIFHVNPAIHNMHCIYLINVIHLIVKASLTQAWQSCHCLCCILQIVCLSYIFVFSYSQFTDIEK